MDPYEPPKANLRSTLRGDAGDLGNLRVNRRPAERRPGLLWVNQILLGIAILGGVVNGLKTVMNPGIFSSMGMAIAADAWTVAILALLGGLMYGLVMERRWAWYGCIAFAVLLVVRGGLTLMNDTGASGGDPGAQAGQKIGQIFAVLLFAINPFALFFSGKVRRFLGVDRPKAG